MSEGLKTPHNQNEQVYGDPVAAAKYDKQIFDSWMWQLERAAGRTSGFTILELGPGFSLGAQILLAERGNRVTVADPFPPTWQPQFHPLVYKELGNIMGGSAALDRAVKTDQIGGDLVRRVTDSAEKLRSLPADEFDIVLSNAVLEHVRRLNRVCSELARVTKVGGINLHQIDLAYHKDRERPLDHLLLSEKEFIAEAADANFEYGNRWRATEFISKFQSVGLPVTYHHVDQKADPEYVEQVRQQIRGAHRAYGDWPVDDLSAISLFLEARRVPIRERSLSILAGRTSVVLQRLRKIWSRAFSFVDGRKSLGRA